MSTAQTTSGLSRMHIRQEVLDAKAYLAEGRQKLRAQHDAGSPGIQVCNRLATLLDEVVVKLYEAILADLDPARAQRLRQHVALVPYGGYGRQDVAPFSDVDLMLLFHPAVEDEVAVLAKRLVTDLGDAGLELGFSARKPSDACRYALNDATILTSLAESRFLAGSQELYDHFAARFKRMAGRRWRRLVRVIDEARRAERVKNGETVFLLEPNVKRSRGGLRDIQLIRWIGFVRYGEVDPAALERAGHLSLRDARALREATAFLLRLRNELHFRADRSRDVLDRAEQVRIAELMGYQRTDAVLPVERFMQDYFLHTREVRNIAAHFVRRAQPRSLLSLLDPVLGISMEGDFRLLPSSISATRRGEQKLQGDLSQVLRLMDLANMADKRIDDRTWEAIRSDMMSRDELQLTDEAIKRFLSLLTQPRRLGELLRGLHELGALEKLIPDFKHARNLLQFNEYHKLTVDAHCIRAVEACTEFQNHQGRIGQVYRSINQKRTLHLALLLHDLGKGFVEDHSEVGRRIAVEVSERFKLPLREARRVEFLVHQHLMMSHLAFRRDTSDEQVVVKFAVDVGSPDRLKMLYVMTASDLGAVGPGVLNEWKLEVLTDLYHRAMRHLAGDSALDTDEHLRSRREAVRKCITDRRDPQWFERQIEALAPGYLFSSDPKQIAEDLARIRNLPTNSADAWGRYLPQSRITEYTIGTYDTIRPGLFHRITGALTSCRLQILSAEINTLADGVVLDRFYVQDNNQQGPPASDRLEQVRQSLIQAATDTSGAPPKFGRLFVDPQRAISAAAVQRLPTQVRFDNDTSDQYTVIDIFAHDRMGLLYAITRTLYELGVSVCVAKIGTYLDQVVDVFYVTDQRTGEKIFDEPRIADIRQRLLAAIDAPNL